MFALAGALVSGNGPSISSYTGLRFAGQSATAFALMNGIGSIGAAVGPYLIGLIGEKFGLLKAIWLMPVFALTLAVFALGWYVKDRAGR
jgi:cyanate permease